MNNKLLYIILIAIIAFTTYFFRYNQPSSLFWDESYNVVKAYKYIDKVMFMHNHPPLGKLLIALGEHLVDPNHNIDTSMLSIKKRSTKKLPKGFSFSGVRLFPALLAFLSSILFYLILYEIFPNAYYAFWFSFLYLFENAFIVHFRGAMLDGIQVFFMLGALLYFLHIYNNKYFFTKNYFILGLLVGLPVSVKYNGLALCLLFVYLIFTEYGKKIIKFNFDIAMIKNFFIKTTISISGILLVLFGTYYAHFTIGKYVVKNRYYWASPQYKDILARNETANPLHFPIMMKDTIKKLFFSSGVRGFKTDKEEKTASQPYGWPLMKKSIRYRWLKKGKKVQYLYLQGNPLIWYTGLSAIIISFFLFIYYSLFKRKRESFNKPYRLIGIFTGLYLFYMISVFTVKRILYLYHYLIPLIFTLFLSYVLFTGIFKNYIQDDNKYVKTGVIFFFISVMITFIFFSPLTYYLPLTYDQFMKRVWLDIWRLIPVR